MSILEPIESHGRQHNENPAMHRPTAPIEWGSMIKNTHEINIYR